MRYIIEVTSKKKETYLQDFLADNKIKIVDQYEPIERLSAEVEKLGRALKEVKENPGSWNILNYYLRGRGFSQNYIDSMMRRLTDFFRNAGIEIKRDNK